MSKKLFFWFLFMLFGKVQLSYAEYFSHLGLSDGLSSPSVMAIYQDCLGRMWFGTREGINVYDGNRISVYQGWVQNGKNAASPIWLGNEVSSIAGDREGDIYILIDRKLIKYDIRKGSFDYRGTSFGTDIFRRRNLVCQARLIILSEERGRPSPLRSESPDKIAY